MRYSYRRSRRSALAAFNKSAAAHSSPSREPPEIAPAAYLVRELTKRSVSTLVNGNLALKTVAVTSIDL
jgi:hypothetical protein